MSTEGSPEIRVVEAGPATAADAGRMVGRVQIIKADKDAIDRPGESKQVEDPFEDMYGEGAAAGIVRPPVNLLELSTLWENNTVLGQCIAAMEVNCDGLGHRFVPRIKVEKLDAKAKAQMEVEEIILDNFFNYASVEDPELAFTDLRMRKRRDQEATGGAWWEVLRNPAGELMGFNVIPSHTCRWSKYSDPIETQQNLLFKVAGGGLKWKTRTVYKRFRKMAQIRAHKVVWFKYFGDPRIIDSRDGEVKDESLEKGHRANECIYFPCVWAPRSPYALPRYIGNLFSVYGSRSSEEINYFTFENNNIPSMAILVSNGMLTDGSIGRVKEFVESHIAGKKNYSQFLILESEPVGEGVANPGTMKLEIKPLTDVQHKDELFQQYDLNNRKKIKGAFRLPPIFTGSTEDYNRATAQVAKVLTDEQVFNPERSTFDNFMNRVILPDLGVVYWQFKSNTPDTTDNETLVKLMAAAEKAGGMTPAIAREVMSDVFSRDLGEVTGLDPNIPFSVQLATAMKNAGNPAAALSSTPGEGVTKADLSPVEKVEKLVEMRTSLEAVYKSAYDKMWDGLHEAWPDEDEDSSDGEGGSGEAIAE